MIYFQAIGDELVFGFDHVGIAVIRKLRMHAVTGFARLAVAEVVGQDDEVLLGIEQLTFAEQLAGESGHIELFSTAGGAMHDEHCITDHALFVALRLAHRAVVDFQFRQRGAVVEMEIVNDVIALGWRRIFGGSNFPRRQ